jgi:integral membrane protein (TIGR00529 family)
VLAAGLLGVSTQTLALTQWPLCLAAIAGGVAFGLLGLQGYTQNDEPRIAHKQTWLLLVKSIWPIALVLGLSLVMSVDLVIALVLTVVLLVAVNRLRPRQLVMLARRMPLGIVAIIAGAMVFRRVLEASGAVAAMSAGLASLHVPVPAVVFFAPFVAGLLTGLLTAAFAIGFPIGLLLAGPDPVITGYGLLAYAGGLAGMLLSPMHLCLSLTRDYYKAEWGGLYQRIVPAAGLLAVAAAIVMAVK